MKIHQAASDTLFQYSTQVQKILGTNYSTNCIILLLNFTNLKAFYCKYMHKIVFKASTFF